MRQFTKTLEVLTRGQGLYPITGSIISWVTSQRVANGLLTVFIQHTSASLVIQENADPDVMRDLQAFFKRLVREDVGLYRHDAEGPDDMPAHIRSALTQVSLSVPLVGGGLALGTWQGIHLFEHRVAPEVRHVVLHLMGD